MVWLEAKKLMRKVTLEKIGEEFKVTLSLKNGSVN